MKHKIRMRKHLTSAWMNNMKGLEIVEVFENFLEKRVGR